MNTDIKEILTTYWSQVVLVLALFGYFGKRYFDYKTKKREVNHSLFQQNKINAVNKFFSCYSENESMWNDFPVYEAYHNKISSKEMDNILLSKRNALYASRLELSIYFDDEVIALIDELINSFKTVGIILKTGYFNANADTVINRANDYAFAVMKATSDNKHTLEKLSKQVRKSFN